MPAPGIISICDVQLIDSIKEATLTLFSLIDDEENFFGIGEQQIVSHWNF